MDRHAPPVSTRLRPLWLPPVDQIAAVPAGDHWDAVAVSGPLGDLAWTHLRRLAPDGAGPVLCDARAAGGRRWFLVPVGTAAVWQEPGTRALGRGSFIVMPGRLDAPTDGIYWASRPDQPPELVDVRLLRQAVAAAREGRP